MLVSVVSGPWSILVPNYIGAWTLEYLGTRFMWLVLGCTLIFMLICFSKMQRSKHCIKNWTGSAAARYHVEVQRVKND